MAWHRYAWTRIRGLVGRRAVERDMEEELRFHVLMRTRENVARGMDKDAARRDALRAFGNVEAIKDDCRDVRGGGMLETIGKDVRYAWRRMLASPGFSAV